jgi:hypothetical protein
MTDLQKLQEEIAEIKSNRLELKETVDRLERTIDDIKKTLGELVLELRGGQDNELRHHDPLFTEVAKNTAFRERATQLDLLSEVKKNTEFRQRSQWTMNLLIGVNTLFTSGIVGLVVMMFINYYAGK